MSATRCAVQLSDPEFVVVDAEGLVSFTEQENNRVTMVDTDGTITTVVHG